MYGLQAQAQFGQGFPGLAGLHLSDWESFMKSITAGYGTDSNGLVGGGALRIESLEHTLMKVIQDHKDFVMFNRLKKTPATATVDEWTEQNGVGGRPGSGFNSELGDIAEQSGSYARRTAQVKYLMTRRSVSFVQNVQNSIISAKASEEVGGTLELLTSGEWGCFEGHSGVVPEEFDGLAKIIEDIGSTDHVIDAEGQPLDSAGFQHIINAAQVIRRRGNYGVPTDIFLSTAAQTDLDLGLDPAFRVPLPNVPNGGIMLGAPVKGVRTSFGDLANNPDIFIEEGGLPRQGESPTGHVTSNPTRPAAVGVAVASDAASKFGAAHAGNYYYAVASVNRNGESDLRIAAQQAIAAGEKCTVTITVSGAGDETGYAIYRSRKGGTNNANDFRLVRRVPRTGASTVYVDFNRDIPGTSKVYVLNMAPTMDAIGLRQLLPMTKFPLYPTAKAEEPWAQLLFIYLRVTKSRQHVMIKNVLPTQTSKVWNPFA